MKVSRCINEKVVADRASTDVDMGKRKVADIDEEPELGIDMGEDDVEKTTSSSSASSQDGKKRKKKKQKSGKKATKGGGAAAGGKGRSAPAKPRTAQVGRSKRRTGAGTKFCRGCGEMRPITDFAANQDLHYVRKSAKDALSKMAKRQKQEAWWEGLVHDDERLKVLVKRFWRDHEGVPEEEQVRDCQVHPEVRDSRGDFKR